MSRTAVDGKKKGISRGSRRHNQGFDGKRSSPAGPAFRFSIPTIIGKALREEYGLQQGDVIELKVVSVVKKGILEVI